MYYPKQIPDIINVDFLENVKYIEYQKEELSFCCMCIWRIQTKKEIASQMITNPILPDACIDLVIDFIHHTICFAGFSKETEQFEMAEDVDYLGVRFKPGAFYSLYQYDASLVMDNMVAFESVDSSFSLKDIFLIKNFEEQINFLINYLLSKRNFQKDDMILFVDKLYLIPTEKTISLLSKDLGYSERHLNRIFKKVYGVTPKVLLNILRLHFCLNLLIDEKKSLIEVSNLCGFYDQSHFIKEIKRYVGISPLQLISRYF